MLSWPYNLILLLVYVHGWTPCNPNPSWWCVGAALVLCVLNRNWTGGWSSLDAFCHDAGASAEPICCSSCCLMKRCLPWLSARNSYSLTHKVPAAEALIASHVIKEHDFSVLITPHFFSCLLLQNPAHLLYFVCKSMCTYCYTLETAAFGGGPLLQSLSESYATLVVIRVSGNGKHCSWPGQADGSCLLPSRRGDWGCKTQELSVYVFGFWWNSDEAV